jgi:hypothetical protein
MDHIRLKFQEDGVTIHQEDDLPLRSSQTKTRTMLIHAGVFGKLQVRVHVTLERTDEDGIPVVVIDTDYETQ